MRHVIYCMLVKMSKNKKIMGLQGDNLSSPTSTMASSINYKDTLFEQTNLTTIRGKPIFETLHKLWNDIKAHAKSVYFNIEGGLHGHLGLVLTSVQYAPILSKPFVLRTHPGPLIILDGTTADANSNM